jgi:hypothetical protein
MLVTTRRPVRRANGPQKGLNLHKRLRIGRGDGLEQKHADGDHMDRGAAMDEERSDGGFASSSSAPSGLSQ